MSLWFPRNTWNYEATNLASTPTTTPGTSVTPAQNAKTGAWASLIAATSYDCFWIEVWIHTNAGATRDTLVDIGIDPAGGTTYAVLLPDLLGSCATDWTGGGQRYFFPVFIPAGSQIAARASINNATVGTARVAIRVKGRPSNPFAIRWGSGVEALGITAASSSGKALTPGATGSEGTRVSIGTLSRECFWFQVGFGVSDSTMTDRAYHADLEWGDGSNFKMIIENTYVGMTAGEEINHVNPLDVQAIVPAGAAVYGRMTSSGTAPDSNYSMAAYGVYA